jgi:hypothetical protein
MLKFKKSGSKYSRWLQVRRFSHRCSWAFQCFGGRRCVPLFWNMKLCSSVLEYDDEFQCYGIRRCVPVFWNMTMCSRVLEYDAVLWNMTLCSSVLEYDAVFQCYGILGCVPVFWNMTLCSTVLEYDTVFPCKWVPMFQWEVSSSSWKLQVREE